MERNVNYEEMLRTSRNRLRDENRKLRHKLAISWMFLMIIIALMVVVIIRMDFKVKKATQSVNTDNTVETPNLLSTTNEDLDILDPTDPLNVVTKTDVGFVDLVYRESLQTDEVLWYDMYSFTDKSYDMIATAYDLSVQSCGKYPDDDGYGITRSGYDLSGMSGPEARCIAVDPDVIPLGTVVYVEFSDFWYKRYDGVYTAYDTGGAIEGNKIDIFMGDFEQEEPHHLTLDFGVTDCKVTVLEARQNGK